MSNAGVTAFFLVPAALYADWHRLAIKRVESNSERAEVAASQATGAARGAQADVDMLSSVVDRFSPADVLAAELTSEQSHRLQDELGLFDTWAERADRASTVAALSHALNIDLIPATGFRAPLPETSLHVRFRYVPTTDELELIVERDDGTKVGAVDWPRDAAPKDVYSGVERVISESGERPGETWVLSLVAVKQGAGALHLARLERATPVLHGDRFYRVVEFTGLTADDEDGWYLTETGVFPRAHMFYFIEASRLDEMDWEAHLFAKGWRGAARALELARAMRKDS